MTESKRVKSFRLGLAKRIPKFPNDKSSLQALEAKSLGGLLVDYANWAFRYIAPRVRKVVVEPSASGDEKWHSLNTDIQALLEKVKSGDDLTPHLSLQPHTRGFTPAASAPGPNVDRWADKDMLLNVMGYHHLHFDAYPTQGMRSDDVLFCHVNRDTLTAIGVFNHTVFEATPPSAVMTSERQRLWEIFDERASRGVPPGSIFAPITIATSGHNLEFILIAIDYARIVKEIDPQLDDPVYVRGLFEEVDIPLPAKPKVKWHMHFLDLCLLEEKSRSVLLLAQRPELAAVPHVPHGGNKLGNRPCQL